MPPGCVQCLSDTDCPAATRHCVNSSCAQCQASADCAGTATPACWPSTHTCGASCAVDAGACSGATPHCDMTTGACVGCRIGGTDCPAATRVCDPSTQQCVVCSSDADCAGTSTPRCDTATHTCAVCATSADCTSPAAPVCRTVTTGGGPGLPPTMTRACQPGCTSNAQCTDGGATACDSNGNCVQCVDDSTCSGARAVCDMRPVDPVFHRCVACLPPPTPDAGSVGCDGGAGICFFNPMTMVYACR
jgi:hypothetical protein